MKNMQSIYPLRPKSTWGNMSSLACSWMLCTSGTVGVFADDRPVSEEGIVQPGHSVHADAFNEGPRQAAYLMQGMGNVHWPMSTKNPMAQRFFDQGIVQLHGFWYFEAERSFRQAAAIDPEQPIFYWGMARANIENQERSRGFIEQAMSRLTNANDKEKRLIEAWDRRVKKFDDNTVNDGTRDRERLKQYAADLEKILYDYPDDIELKAMLALQFWQNDGAGESMQSHFAVNALMTDILRENPRHPVHHFRIHIWDYRKESLALDAAAKCGPAAPGIAHMWHMPGHTYTRLHRYADAAWQQEASARVDHAHMMRDRVLPDQIHNFAHNNEWLIRNLIHLGRVQQAIALAKNMIELPRHPKYNDFKNGGSSKLGRERLLNVLTAYGLWPELASLSKSTYLEPTADELRQDEHKSWLAIAELNSGNFESFQSLRTELQQTIENLKSECIELRAKNQLQADTERKDSEVALKRPPELQDAFPINEDWFGDENDPAIIQIPNKEIDQSELKDWSTELQEASKATRLKEHRLAKLKQFELAIQAFEAARLNDYKLALQSSNGCRSIVNSLTRLEWLALAGKAQQALEKIEKRINDGPNEFLPLAIGVWIASLNDPANEKGTELAKQWIKTLSLIAATADEDIALVKRIEPIVEQLGLKEAWRKEGPTPSDVGDRPSLDSLGPFRWTPSLAPFWIATGSDGVPRSPKNYAKKPLVMIFYLGFGCLHCAEQLKEFSPMMDQYRAAGLEIVAISSETLAQMQVGIKNFGSEMRFPLMVNPELDMFREFRCFDDFEGVPLHGTFIIDAEGLVRWQDIGFEPFKDAAFLLEEAKRLLKL